MKLQKDHACNSEDKPAKYIIKLTDDLICELGWGVGSKLEAKIVNDKIQISCVSKSVKNQKRKTIKPKITYSEFKEKIQKYLAYRDDDDVTWIELRDQLELEQVVPDNKWVRQLERDIGLTRIKSTKGVIWRASHV